MPYSDCPILGADVVRTRKIFLKPSASKQVRNYDTDYSNYHFFIYQVLSSTFRPLALTDLCEEQKWPSLL